MIPAGKSVLFIQCKRSDGIGLEAGLCGKVLSLIVSIVILFTMFSEECCPFSFKLADLGLV
jgi:hypothetical protein